MQLQVQKLTWLTILLSAVVLGSTGCSRVQANVEAFSSLPLSGALKSIHVKTYPESLNSSLEWKAYRKIFEQAFEERDYVIVPDEESADYVAFVEYDLAGAGQEETTRTIPIQIGDSVTFLSKKVSDDVYRRTILMVIFTKDMDSVYEGRVVSKGTCGSLSQVMHELVEALFEKFPRGSGKVRIFGNFDC